VFRKIFEFRCFKSEQKIVAQPCGVSHMTVWRICIEGKNSSVGSDEEMQFKSPWKFHKHTKKNAKR